MFFPFRYILVGYCTVTIFYTKKKTTPKSIPWNHWLLSQSSKIMAVKKMKLFGVIFCFETTGKITMGEFPLKNDGTGRRSFPFWGRSNFQGRCLLNFQGVSVKHICWTCWRPCPENRSPECTEVSYLWSVIQMAKIDWLKKLWSETLAAMEKAQVWLITWQENKSCIHAGMFHVKCGQRCLQSGHRYPVAIPTSFVPARI